MKKIKVHLLAFNKTQEVPVTEVSIPENSEIGYIKEFEVENELELVYKAGQNEFRQYEEGQEQTRSVSMGDVIELNGKFYIVGMYGFISDEDNIEKIVNTIDFELQNKFETSHPFIAEKFPKLFFQFSI